MCFHLTFSISFAASDDPLVLLHGQANKMKITSAGSGPAVGFMSCVNCASSAEGSGRVGKGWQLQFRVLHTHTHTHTHIHTYIHTHIHTYTHIYIYTHTYTHTHIHKYIHTHIHTHSHTVYLCVLCGSENKQRLFPYTT